MTDRDEYFRARLIADYDRLIREIEGGMERAGVTFGLFITPMDGKLIAASLRTARLAALSTKEPRDDQ